jgi:hypothetical protein
MGKEAKKHRKKVEARNNRLKQDKLKNDKIRREFFLDLIKKEKEMGMFDNTPSIKSEGPIIEGPTI